MEKEVFDIIDTAVKIGLGALISGVSTYYLTLTKNNHDKEKYMQDRISQLLEDIVLKLESANSKMSEATHPFWHLILSENIDSYPEAAKISLDLFLDAKATFGQARALLNLLAVPNVIDKITKIEQLVEDIYQKIASEKIIDKPVLLNGKLTEIGTLLEESYQEIAIFHKCYS